MKILFPTDFSKNAKNAYSFALKFKELLNAEITLFHAYQVPLLLLKDDEPEYLKTKDGIEKGIQDKCETFVNCGDCCDPDNQVKNQMPSYQIREGNAVSCLLDETEKGDFDLVIMGTKGEGDQISEQWGSVTSAFVRESNTPTLVVPSSYQEKSISTIAIAEDFDVDDSDALKFVASFSKKAQADVVVFHGTSVKDYENATRSENYSNIKYRYSRLFGNLKFDFIHAAQKGMLKSILDYIQGHEVDLLVMFNREEAYRDMRQEKRLLEELTLQIEIPLLIL